MEDNNLVKLISGNGQIPFLRTIDGALLQAAVSDSRVLSSKKREFIFVQDEIADSFFIVKSGLFKLVKKVTADHTIVHDIITPDEMVGSLLMNTPGIKYPVSLQCILNGEVLAIPRSTYDAHWKNNPQLLHLMQMQTQRRIFSIQEIRNSSKFALEKRMAYVIKNYLAKIAPGQNSVLALTITRNDMADLVSSTVESVIRVFAKWSNMKITENVNNIELINLSSLDEHYLRQLP